MRKRLVLGGLVVLGVLIAAGLGFWYLMQQPLYLPGMVRAGQNLAAPLEPPSQSGAQDFWDVEPGIRLHHFAGGAGPSVLVVHGGPGLPFSAPPPGLARLAQHYTINYYDQRGCGESSRPISRFTSSNTYANIQQLDRALGLGAQIADIERIRRLLGDEQLILVGHSFGGFIASLYAAEFPERVKALVLIAPAETLVMPPESGGLFEQIKPLLPDSDRPQYDAFLKRYLDYGSIWSKSESDLVAENAEFARYYVRAAARQGFDVPAGSASGTGGWMAQALYFSMGLRHDYRDALKAVPAPVLVLHGAKDLQPEQASRLYADVFPNAEFRVIANAGHFVFSDQPDEFAQVVGEFLARQN